MLLPSIFGENLFDDFFNDFARPVRTLARVGMAQPSVMRTDIKETEDGFQLDVDLPGYKKEDVKAQLKDGYLTISADTKQETADEQGQYVRRERYYGSCSRSFYVGDDLTQEDIKAKFEDGILKVSVPKKEVLPAADEPQFISIQ